MSGQFNQRHPVALGQAGQDAGPNGVIHAPAVHQNQISTGACSNRAGSFRTVALQAGKRFQETVQMAVAVRC